ncbi:tubulin-specific chaperone E-like [Uloborus diversus]|uniref:tubulin-specific chaperone E-like n=1 Tax=Uloborus diversus TaxID=327109 RepID=UPI0024094888|nr:tubulin-specific chaperone E-like [Uloborus diversus]XP_054714060.1 tubulin-specific chaperone E-like [Uloborus diversus]XP_054714061.1 tubulin-specific chaperone E-like [Uloborus diversus]
MGAASLQLGCRIYCDGEYGTVLYIGLIDGVEGTWVGIEWDNPTRGKHSGSYNNRKYFETRIPNAGSFIKISKAETGISCPNAIKLKYGKDGATSATFINLPQKTGRERHIEMVGMEKIMGKQSNYLCLTDVVLSRTFVNGPGDKNELLELTPNIRNLDLSENLLSSWCDVIAIAEQLPHLSSLILSKNRLKLIKQPSIQECFSVLKMLVMNEMAYSWKEILSCASMCPFVEQLFVVSNKITELEAPLPPIFSQLTMLSLNHNPIGEWTEICKLGSLTNLTELHVNNINLQSISFPKTPPLEKTELFSNLQTLYVQYNNLNQWQDITELNKLRKLKNLTISHNPVVETVKPETARQFTIAKIIELEMLNRTKIERFERRGAELDYIKLHHKEWIANGGSSDLNGSKLSESFLRQHPTYCSLVQKHGASDGNEIKEEKLVLKDDLLSVIIFSPLLPDKPSVTKKLPAEMTVGKLKALVQRLFKVSAQNVLLTHISKENELQKTIMDNNLRELSFYSISNQDKIAVEW